MIVRDNPVTNEVLKDVVADSYGRLIAPAIEREIRNELTEKAEEGAISVFGKNLQQLLMQPPIAGRVVAGLGSGLSDGLQAGGRGCDRKGAGYKGDLSDRAAEQGRGGEKGS